MLENWAKEKLLLKIACGELTNEPRCTETVVGIDTIVTDTECTTGLIQTVINVYLTESSLQPYEEIKIG